MVRPDAELMCSAPRRPWSSSSRQGSSPCGRVVAIHRYLPSAIADERDRIAPAIGLAQVWQNGPDAPSRWTRTRHYNSDLHSEPPQPVEPDTRQPRGDCDRAAGPHRPRFHGGRRSPRSVVMQILIDSGSYHCLNVGDVAMLQAGIERLRDLWPNASIAVVTNSPDALALHCRGVRPVPLSGRVAFLSDRFFGRADRLLLDGCAPRSPPCRTAFGAGGLPHRRR